MATVYVNDQWSGKVAGDKVSVNGVEYTIGTDAFASVNEAHAAVLPTGDKLVVIEGANAVYDHGGKYFYLNAESGTDEVIDASETYDLDIDGTLSAYQIILNNAETNVSATGKIRSTNEDLRVLGGSLMVQGTRADGEELVGTDLSDNIWQSRLVPTDKAQISTGYLSVMYGAEAEFNDTGVLIHAGSFRIKEFGKAEFYNSVISIGNASTYGGSTISVTDGGLLWLCDHSAIYRGENVYTTADVITLSIGEGANVTVDASSFIQIDAITIAEGGVLAIDAAQMYKDGKWVDTYTGGTIKVVDLNMSSALSAEQVELFTKEGQENVKMVFGKDGDIYLTDADTSTIYVNPEYANSTSPDLGDGKVLGVNAFATSKEAYMAARDMGGEVTIDLTNAGTEALDGTVGFGNANKDGVYTITGGNGRNTTSYGISTANTNITVKFEDAAFKIGKAYFANSGSALFVDNSVIGTAYYDGHNSGWFTAGKGNISISDSIFGINYANFTDEEIAGMSRTAAEVAEKKDFWAAANNNSGYHMGTAGEIDVDNSTVSTSWISLVDRALMTLDNSVLYYGGAISIGVGQVDSQYGSYNSNEIGWDCQLWWNPPLSSAAGFREGEVATLTVTDSIVRNLGGGNGDAGAHVQVGGSFKNGIDSSIAGEMAGELNLVRSEFSTTLFDANGNAIARDYDMLVVKSNGTVNVEDSKLISAKVVNEGEFNVTGESTLNISTLTGNAIEVYDGADITDSYVGGAVNLVSGESSWSGENTVTGVFSAGYYNYEEGDITVNITGDFTNGNLLAWNVDGSQTTVNIGSANAARTTFNGGQIGIFENTVVNINNADVSYNYSFIRSDFNVTGSALTCTNANTYFSGLSKVVVDSSTWYLGSFVTLGGYGVDIAVGSADMTLQNGSTVTAGNVTLAAVTSDAYSVSLTVKDATFTATGTFTVGAGTSFNVAADSVVTIGTLAGAGTITIDATDFAGGVVKVVDANSSTFTGEVTVTGNDSASILRGEDGDVFLATGAVSTLYVNYAWAGKAVGEEVDGKTFGFDAFATVHQAINAATDKTSLIEVVEGEAVLYKKVTTANPDGLVINMGNNGVTVNKNSAIVDADGNDAEASVYSYITDGAEIGSGVTVNADIFFTVNMGKSAQIDGIVNVNGAGIQSGQVVIGAGGELNVRDLVTLTASGSDLVVEGNFTAGEVHFHDSTYGSAFTVANGGVATVTDLILFTSGSELNVEEGGKLYVTNVSVESMNVAAGGEIAINADGVTETTKMLDVDTIANAGTLTVENLEDGMFTMTAADGDIWVVANTIYVDGSWAADTAFGTEVAEGKFFGVNAFASLKSISTEASQGIRKVVYTASESGSMTLTVTGEKYTAYTIAGENSYVMAGRSKDIPMAVTAGNEYTFEFTNATGDFDLSAKFTGLNESEIVDITTDPVFADTDIAVAPGTGAKSYTFTVADGYTADFHFTIDLVQGKLSYTLTEGTDNVLVDNRTMGDFSRTIRNLAAGTYTFAVDTYAGKDSLFNFDAEVSLKKIKVVDPGHVSDADDTSDKATKLDFASAAAGYQNWVGAEDLGDWVEITDFNAGASTTFTLSVGDDDSRVSATIYSQVAGGRLRQVRSWSSGDTASTTLTLAADTQYFVRINGIGDSNYTLQLA